MIKLLIVTHALEKGGAEKLIVSLAPHFKERGVIVEILLLNKNKSVDFFVNEIRKNEITIHDLNITNIYNPTCILQIKKFLQNNFFDIIHTHLFPSLYWIRLATFLIPNSPKLIYTEHSNHNKRREKFLLKYFEKFIYQGYDRIVTITDEVKQNLSNWVGYPDKMTTISNGVDIKAINNSSVISKYKLLAEFNVPEDAVTIFMAASFRYPKDQQTVIKACALLGNKYHLLLAGEGNLENDCRLVAQSLGVSDQIHFLGFRNNVASLMKSVDINVLSSDYEGMSGVTLEALASGKPFIGSDVAGIREIVPSHEFLFLPGNEQDLADKVHFLVNNTQFYNYLSKEGLSFSQKFSIEEMADAHTALYSSLLTVPKAN